MMGGHLMAKTVVKIHGADQIMKLLRELPKSLTTGKAGGVPAKALRKGAKVIYDYEKPLLERAIDEDGDESSGLLVKNFKIRRKKSTKNQEHMTISAGNAKYKVAGETVTAKNGKTRPAYKKGANTRLNAARLEYGTEHQRAHGFARKAFAAKAAEAISTTEQALLTDLEKIAKKHMPKAK